MVAVGAVAATYSPDDDEAPFWLCRVDGIRGSLLDVTWLEPADDEDNLKYELGEPQHDGIELSTVICPVGATLAAGTLSLPQRERDVVLSAIAAAVALESDDGEDEPAAAPVPAAAAAPIVVVAGAPTKFEDPAFVAPECTVVLDQTKAGAELPYPPKPGFKLSSPRQFAQFVGKKVEDMPGVVRCDKMLDTDSALFKDANRLIQAIATDYEKWRRHFAEVESALGVGWKQRLNWAEPYKAYTNALDGPVTASITRKQGGYGPVKLGGEAPPAQSKAQKAAAEANVQYEKLTVQMNQDQGMYWVALNTLKQSITCIKNLEKKGDKYPWTIEAHPSTGLPVVTGFTDKTWAGAKKLAKKVDWSVIAVGTTPVYTPEGLEAALKSVRTKAVNVFMMKNEATDGATAAGSLKKYQLKAMAGKMGYGWDLKDNADGSAVIVKLLKDGSKDGPAKSNDVPLKGLIRQIEGKAVHGTKEVQAALKKHAGKKVLFMIEKAREKAKSYTSVKHMDAMGVTKFIYGVSTELAPIYGHIPGINVGDEFIGRNAASCVGLHRPHMTGICFPTWFSENTGKKDHAPSMGIVMSGGYEDDEELDASEQANTDDRFWYTGDGGNDVLASSAQTSDQKHERGNRALVKNFETKIPVRVNRGIDVGGGGKTITYNGLYRVSKYTFENGKSGHKIYRFLMERIKTGQSKHTYKAKILHKMVGNQSDKYARWKRDFFVNDFIDPKTGKRKDKKDFAVRKRPTIKDPHMICADISDGQERRPIPCFNEVDKEKLPKEFSYIKTSQLVGSAATSFVPEHSYPTIDHEIERVDECPCVQLTAQDGNGHKHSLGEAYHAGGGLWNARDAIYECHSCTHSTLKGLLQNRVVQGGIQHHLEVFKTKRAGWGMRAWNEIPAGSFICTYEGEIMSSEEADALAKEPEMTDRYYYDLKVSNLGNRPENFGAESSESEDDEPEEAEEAEEKKEVKGGQEPEQAMEVDVVGEEAVAETGGRRPRRSASKKTTYNEDAYYNSVGGDMLTATGKRARKAAAEAEESSEPKRRKKKKNKKKKKEAAAAAASAADGDEDEEDAEFVVDGQRRGNVGRFFNHSSEPNLFMQCVFTGVCAGHAGKYDKRMPTLAFFAMADIPAGTELTFDYGKSHAEMHNLHDNVSK